MNPRSTQERVVRELRSLAGSALTQKVKECALELGVHESTVYRWIGGTGRARRSDRGIRRAAPENEMAERMMAMTVRYGMTAEMVIEHAEYMGWIAPKSISAATYNRMLRARGIALSDLGKPGRMDNKLLRNRFKTIPHRSWEAPYANMIHQLDITELPRYFVEPDGSIGFESPLTLGTNKRGNTKPRLHLFVDVDDHSRGTYARLYFSKNELNWIDFCIRAWSPKDDPAQFPMQGRPELLYSDNDSAPKGKMFTDFITDMEVDFAPHVVGNSPAKGKVERRIRDLKEKLVMLFRVVLDQGRTLTLAEANAILDDLLYRVNGRRHSVTGESPMMRWRTGIQGHPVRMLPSDEILERYFYDCAMCRVYGNLTVRLGGAAWQLPRKNPFLGQAGARVPVYFHRGEPELQRLLIVIDDTEHVIEAKIAQPDAAGEFKSLPTTDQEKLLDRLYKKELGDIQSGGFYKERYSQVYFPTEEDAFDENRLDVPRRMLSRIDFKERLRADGVRFDSSAVDAFFAAGGEIDEAEYEAYATRFGAQRTA